jgi:hypothetical protein
LVQNAAPKTSRLEGFWFRRASFGSNGTFDARPLLLKFFGVVVDNRVWIRVKQGDSKNGRTTEDRSTEPAF